MYIKFETFTLIIKTLCYVISPIISVLAGIALWLRMHPTTFILGLGFFAWAILEPMLAHDGIIKSINEVQTMKIGVGETE